MVELGFGVLLQPVVSLLLHSTAEAPARVKLSQAEATAEGIRKGLALRNGAFETHLLVFVEQVLVDIVIIRSLRIRRVKLLDERFLQGMSLKCTQ